MDRVRDYSNLPAVSGNVLHHRRSSLGRHLVYRPGGIRRRLYRYQFRDLAVSCTGGNACGHGSHQLVYSEYCWPRPWACGCRLH